MPWRQFPVQLLGMSERCIPVTVMKAFRAGFSFAIWSRHCLVNSTEDRRRNRSARAASAMVIRRLSSGRNVSAESASGGRRAVSSRKASKSCSTLAWVLQAGFFRWDGRMLGSTCNLPSILSLADREFRIRLTFPASTADILASKYLMSDVSERRRKTRQKPVGTPTS